MKMCKLCKCLKDTDKISIKLDGKYCDECIESIGEIIKDYIKNN